MSKSEWVEPRLRPAAEDGWRARWFRIVFHHGSAAERRFDVLLLLVIAISVVIAILDSVRGLHQHFADVFYTAEWVFTLLFTAEYIVRLLVVRRPLRYALSFYGLIDLAAALPTYISLFVFGAEHLIVIRVLRILRVFRVLAMVEYSREGSALMRALYASRRKIGLFLLTVLLVTVVFGAIMYLVEGPQYGFTSIPRSMYWSIVTMATVGFGDITPHTPLGQFITSIIVLIGYGMIAVPTGIFGAELLHQQDDDRRAGSQATCARCSESHHVPDSNYCHRCGERLPA